MSELTEYLPQVFEYGFDLIIVIVAWHFKDIRGDIKEMNQSVNTLNMNMALMFEKHDTKEKQIESLEKDVRGLRDRMHEINNTYTPKIQLNEERIRMLEKRGSK